MPTSGRLEPRAAELGRAVVRGREGRDAHDRDEHRQDDHQPDRREQRAGQRAARLACLLGEVRDRLEAGVGEESERNREEQVVEPVLAGRERQAVDEGRRGEQEREAEDHEERLHEQVEEGDDERRPVQP